MQRKYKIRYSEWILIILGWLIVFYLYFIFAWWGVKAFLQKGWLIDYLESPNIHYEITIQAIIFGLLFNVINTVISKSELSKKSFGTIIFIKTFLYSIAIVFSQAFVFLVFYIFNIVPTEEYGLLFDLVNFEFILSLVLYFTLSITFLILYCN